MLSLNSNLTVAASLFLGALLPAAAEQSTPPPAPAPGAPAIYVSSEQLTENMRAAIARPSDPALSPIGVSDQYFINEVHRTKGGAAAVHPGWTELHLILAGSATFVTGGKIVTLPGGAGSAIEGGVSRKVGKGDAIIVPPNTPHWYNQIDGSLTSIEVRVVAPVAATSAK
jgi:mannose-6-phosphate isomerase-like protein (cupin superfamily)